MENYDTSALKAKVPCSALLEATGWKVDLRESTPKAVKYRRGDGEIIIVIHHGRGWFEPTSDAKGDVLSLAQHLGAPNFGAALKTVAELIGFEPTAPAWQRKSRNAPAADMASRWAARARLASGSAAWTYLTKERALPAQVLVAATEAGSLREGPKGSVWAAHVDHCGRVVGWEERGPGWRGFATGGAKALFLFGAVTARRVCITEAAIDAMSLAGLEGSRPDSLYASTGGGWAPATEAALRALAARPGAELVAATDANDQGDAYAARLKDIATATGAGFLRLWPNAVDWNEQLTHGEAVAGPCGEPAGSPSPSNSASPPNIAKIPWPAGYMQFASPCRRQDGAGRATASADPKRPAHCPLIAELDKSRRRLAEPLTRNNDEV